MGCFRFWALRALNLQPLSQFSTRTPFLSVTALGLGDTLGASLAESKGANRSFGSGEHLENSGVRCRRRFRNFRA